MKARPITMALATLGLCAAACTSNPELAKTEETPPPVVVPAEPVPAEPVPLAVEPAEPVPAEPVPAEVPVTKVDDPPPLAAAATLPAVLDPKAPATVFAALVDTEHEQWAVDIVDPPGVDAKRLEEQLVTAMEKAEDDGRVALDPGSHTFPAGFAVGDPWTLVSRKGAEHRTATGFDAGLGEALHFYVRLGKPPKKAKDPRLAFRGHLDLTTTLVVPEAIRPAELGAGTLDHIVKTLEPGLDPELRDLTKGLVIRESHVKLFPGRFPGTRTHVAFVLAQTRSEDMPPVSGVLFVAADGSVEFFAAAGVMGTVKLFGLLDVNGDGFDEVFYEDQYHEGWYLEMIQWDGEKPRGRTVTGDGL